MASRSLPKGGTAMFALLALFGDLGCSGGPTLVGMVSGAFGGELKTGLLFAVVFSVFIGLGSGYYPANKAVQIPALEAIKSE